MAYRTKIEIYYEFLEALLTRNTYSRLEAKVNLNTLIFRKFLNSAVKNNFLIINGTGNRKTYNITITGREYFYKLKSQLEEQQKLIKSLEMN